MKKILFENRTRKQIIFKNTFWLSAAEGISRLLKFGLIIYVTRLLGPSKFGEFSFALAYVSLFMVFADFGLPVILTREIAQGKAHDDDFSAVLGLKTTLTILTFLAMFIVGYFTNQNPAIRMTIAVLAVYGVSSSLIELFFAYLQAHQKLEYEAGAKIIQAVITTFFGILLVGLFSTPVSLGLGYLFGATIIFFGVGITFFYRVQRFRVVFVKTIWKKYLTMSWPLAFTGMFATIYNNIDSVMMGHYNQIVQVGIYSAAYKIIGIYIIPSVLLYRSFFAAINKKDINIRKFYFNTLLAIGLIICLFSLVFAPFIMNIIFGPAYMGGVFALRVLSLTVPLAMLIGYYTQILTVHKKQKIVFYSTMAGAVLNVCLNVYLIPRYSLNGAAFATLTSFMLVLLAQFNFSRSISD